ncbi:(2Fe-2S) ferredoxin domain-containing protein [Proteiniborus sp. MB09-C3]|uniref:(2Fe-2S) ferredoxin domain-containing protein n=1 Tax=Proteiniborus sp. MB09-C3 TaxID=3050072 RepID=UPI00255275A1|nr:(2Fe-2S) ferredoxin domain-containing protein [Proteiniborus sp. MB09-C3]WIV11721.1 (2Fe-2S) ferredoxin domain-containing protein [Proteiniborus sp. MB09-C3]
MVTINVCIGSACHLKGAYEVINNLQHIIEERELSEKVIVKAAFCLGECTKAVSVRVDEDKVVSVGEETVKEFFEQHVVGRL